MIGGGAVHRHRKAGRWQERRAGQNVADRRNRPRPFVSPSPVSASSPKAGVTVSTSRPDPFLSRTKVALFALTSPQKMWRPRTFSRANQLISASASRIPCSRNGESGAILVQRRTWRHWCCAVLVDRPFLHCALNLGRIREQSQIHQGITSTRTMSASEPAFNWPSSSGLCMIWSPS